MTGNLFLKLTVLVYILSAAGYLVYIFRQDKRALQGGTWLIRTGFVCHSLSLILTAVHLGQLPALDIRGALGFSGWALVAVYLLLTVRFDIPSLGAFISPPAAILALVSSLGPAGPVVLAPIFQGLWLTIHLGTVFIGYGFLGLAFTAGVMYLMQEHRIKTKNTRGLFHRLPSLNALDTLNYHGLTMGFLMITLGLLSGAVYAQLTLGAYWRWDPKEVWAVITWLIYAAMIHQRLTVGWRGRRAAFMSIIGFSVLCFTFLGVDYLLPSYHSFESFQTIELK